MAKYKEVVRDIEELFIPTNWIETAAYPSNYQGGDFAAEFIKIEILPLNPLTTYGSLGVSGQVIIQIYTKVGEGYLRAVTIADALDTILQVKTLPRGTQTGTSSIAFLGNDTDDNSLFRADYTVSFRKY